MKLRSALALSLLSLSIIFPVAALAQWYPDGTPVCLSKNSSATDQAVSDGAGGMIVVWADFRNGSNYDIYAQRIDANGVVQWTADGAAVCTAANQQQYPTRRLRTAPGACSSRGRMRAPESPTFTRSG